MKRFIQLLTLISHFAFIGCEKNWLDAKRDLNTVIPTSLQDYRSILNSSSSPSMAMSYVSLPLTPGEEYVVTDANFNAGSELNRNLYSWNTSIFPASTTTVSDWNDSYQQVFNANVVLDGLPTIERNASNTTEWDDVKGGALFFRSKTFYELAQVFAAPFDPSSTFQNPNGIPLRLSSDATKTTTQSSVDETYDRIVQDLQTAIPLLTLSPRLLTDASRPAAYALLARCFLSMRQYSQALAYADTALSFHPTLLDYSNLIDRFNDSYPLPDMNQETIFYSAGFTAPSFLLSSRNLIVPELIALYQDHDLRRILFFKSSGAFKGHYTASFRFFHGLAADELYLIRAECLARAGMDSKALDDLNTLLSHRYATEYFVPLTSANTADVLETVLQERRKELLFRGLRWTDLRRLNQEPEHAITLQRAINGQTYSLPPNSSRYTLPIPDYIIQQTGINQNQRIQE